MKVMKEICKKYGIDIDLLLEEKIIANESCFWCLLQSQTDRLNHYYYDEEHRIKEALSHPKRRYLPNESAIVTLASIRNQVIWLLDFITHNVKLFASMVSKFDDFHHLDTFHEEMAYFKETYAFIDGHGLYMILNLIDEMVLEIEATVLQENTTSPAQKDGEPNFSIADKSRSTNHSMEEDEKKSVSKKRRCNKLGSTTLRVLLRRVNKSSSLSSFKRQVAQ